MPNHYTYEQLKEGMKLRNIRMYINSKKNEHKKFQKWKLLVDNLILVH